MEWLVHTYLHDCESSGYQHITSLSVLQAGAVKGELHKTDYKRLNLGVAAAAIALTAVRVLHWDTQSILGHLETVMQGGLTGVMPSAYLMLEDASHCISQRYCQRSQGGCTTGKLSIAITRWSSNIRQRSHLDTYEKAHCFCPDSLHGWRVVCNAYLCPEHACCFSLLAVL